LRYIVAMLYRHLKAQRILFSQVERSNLLWLTQVECVHILSHPVPAHLFCTMLNPVWHGSIDSHCNLFRASCAFTQARQWDVTTWLA